MSTHTTSTSTTTSSANPTAGAPTASQKINEAGTDLKGALAGIHGVGEKVRGEFNAGIDRAFETVSSPSPPAISFRF
jgi:hypothetical protein